MYVKEKRQKRLKRLKPAVLPNLGSGITIMAVTTISLKLPETLLARLDKESRARRTTKSSLVRECLERELSSASTIKRGRPVVRRKDSFFEKALPVLKKAWSQRGRRISDLATNPKHMEGFGK